MNDNDTCDAQNDSERLAASAVASSYAASNRNSETQLGDVAGATAGVGAVASIDSSAQAADTQDDAAVTVGEDDTAGTRGLENDSNEDLAASAEADASASRDDDEEGAEVSETTTAKNDAPQAIEAQTAANGNDASASSVDTMDSFEFVDTPVLNATFAGEAGQSDADASGAVEAAGVGQTFYADDANDGGAVPAAAAGASAVETTDASSDLVVGVGESVTVGMAGGLTFTLNAAAGMSAQALAGFQAAADLWSAVLTDNVNIVLDVDFSPLASANTIAQAGSTQSVVSYAAVRTALQGDSTSADDATAVANLQNTTGVSLRHQNDVNATVTDNNGSVNNNFMAVNKANTKALGIVTDANGNPIDQNSADASITFNSNFSFDLDRSDGIAANQVDFIGVAAHEIGHALGFVSVVDTYDFYQADPNSQGLQISQLQNFAIVSVLDLFRETAATTGNASIDVTYNTSSYLSLDNGLTSIGALSNGRFNGSDAQQASHFKDNQGLGILDPTASNGELLAISNNDLQALDAIGWDRASATQPVKLFDTSNTQVGTFTTIAAAEAVASTGYRIEVVAAGYTANPETVTVDQNNLTVDIESGVTPNLNLSGAAVNLTLAGAGNGNVTGTSVANTLFGNTGDNTLSGGGGADVLSGAAGSDTLLGGEGNDALSAFNTAAVGGDAGVTNYLWGGAGDDTLYGGDGADLLVGEAGVDAFFGGGGEDFIYIDQDDVNIDGGAGQDRLFVNTTQASHTLNVTAANVEVVFGGNEANIQDATGSNSTVYLFSTGGNDVLTGGNAVDVLSGGADQDILSGNGSIDYLYTGTGADRAIGGAGDDFLILGDGAGNGDGDIDHAEFGDGSGTDRIYEFDDGTDIIDLTPKTGLTTFSQLAISDVAGGVGITYGGDTIYIVGNYTSSQFTSDDFLL